MASAGLRRSLPPVSALLTFEAAARHLSFTRAAAELGVTQAAVSRQVRALEDDLGGALFVRHHRRVDLTAAGRQLAGAVAGGFGRMAEAVALIRSQQAQGTVTIGATLAFAHFWLLPRLARLRRDQPGIRVRVVSRDARFDLRDGEVQIAVPYGRPRASDGRVLASMADSIFPVASPAFAAQNAAQLASGGVLSLPLIAIDWDDPEWTTWSSWAAGAGLGRLRAAESLRFTHYIDAVYAAMNGEGVALGWGRLLADPLAQGRLVRLGDAADQQTPGYHVVVTDDFVPDANAAAVLDWLAGQFAPEAADT